MALLEDPSAMEVASWGTWNRLRKALVKPSNTGRGRPRRVVRIWWVVAGSKGAIGNSRDQGPTAPSSTTVQYRDDDDRASRPLILTPQYA